MAADPHSFFADSGPFISRECGSGSSSSMNTNLMQIWIWVCFSRKNKIRKFVKILLLIKKYGIYSYKQGQNSTPRHGSNPSTPWMQFRSETLTKEKSCHLVCTVGTGKWKRYRRHLTICQLAEYYWALLLPVRKQEARWTWRRSSLLSS